MSQKTLIMICMAVGTFLGSYGTAIFGVDPLSLWSVILGAVGGMIGIWVGWKLSNF